MRITYDASTDALYVALVPIEAAQATRTDEVEPGLLLDRDDAGRLLGIEILGARGRGIGVDRLDVQGLPVSATASRVLAGLGGSQHDLEAPPRRRSATS